MIDNIVHEIKNILLADEILVYFQGSIKSKNSLQKFLDIKFNNFEKQKLYETILSYALEAEKTCPGSGLLLLQHLCFSKFTSVLEDDVIKNSKDIENIFEKKNFSSKIRSILTYLTKISNSSTKVTIKKSSNENTIVDINPGFTFSLKSLFKDLRVNLDNPKVICIDGYIESISEIHHILTFLSESSYKCLLFSRGMSEDVLYTIKTNNDRGTLCVYPFIVPFDIDNSNTIVDLAVVAGTDIVSSLKGDLISNISVDKMGNIEFCEIYEGNLKIKNRDKNGRISSHIKSIKKSIEERPEIQEILSKRLKSLTSNCIDIHLPDDINFYKNSQQLDEGIRILSSIFNNKYTPELVANKFLQDLKKTLKDFIVLDLQIQ